LEVVLRLLACTASLPGGTACSSELTRVEVRWGLGMYLKDIDMPPEQIAHHYFLDLFVDMWFYTFSVGLSKFVILGFYWRMFSTSLIRQPIRILFACSAAWIVVRVGHHIAKADKSLTNE
jgi:hypothetical protein